MKKKSCSKQSVLSKVQTDSTIDFATINKKLPSWSKVEGLQFPTKLCLEQCSGENAAAYKSDLVSRLFPHGGNIMADLTGGLGVDFSFIVRHFQKGIYIERQSSLCEAAKNNFPRLGLGLVEIVEGNGIDHLKDLPPTDLIFLDPARRDNIGRKTVFIEDCEPDVISLLPELWKKTNLILLKLSPMLDLSRAMKSLGNVSEAHIVADGGECKELLLVLQPEVKKTRIFCHDQKLDFTFSPEEETNAQVSYTSEVGSFLYEPGVSLLKAGAFKLIAQRFHLKKLHPNSHLYTSDEFVNDFPGRTFEIKQISSFGKKELKALCQSVDKANLTIRNFPGSVAELRKRMKLKEGGDAYWFATTLANEKHIILDCRKCIQ